MDSPQCLSRLRRAAMVAGLIGIGLWAVGSLLAHYDRPRVVAPRTGAALVWMGHELEVPASAVVEANGPDELVVLERPRARIARRIRLSRWSSSSVDWEQRAEFPGGGSVSWRTARSAGGSGGEEVEIQGRVTSGGADLAFSCTDQSELDSDGTWCLPWLATVHRGDPAAALGR